jgi:hypothetical protein
VLRASSHEIAQHEGKTKYFQLTCLKRYPRPPSSSPQRPGFFPQRSRPGDHHRQAAFAVWYPLYPGVRPKITLADLPQHDIEQHAPRCPTPCRRMATRACGLQGCALCWRDVFAAEHGTWNRGNRVGYEVICIAMHNGHADGSDEGFLTGLVTKEGQVWGRPVGVAIAKDGSMFVTDDDSCSVWHVSYVGK